MAITVEELLVEFKADSSRFAQEHRRVQEAILKSEAASFKLQRSLDKLQGTKPPDLGARSARDAAKSYGDLADRIGELSGARLGGVGAIATGFVAAARAGLTYRDTLDKLNRSFVTLLGSEEAATRHLKELHAFASATPYNFEEVAKASQKFHALGIAAKDVLPLLQSVGNAVARAGGGSEEVERVAKGISDIMARGKTSAADLNQLSNNLVDAWKPLEVELGKTKAELFKMSEAGEISAETFVRAFRKAHESANAMENQMTVLSKALTTLEDNGKLALANFFNPLYQQLRLIAVGLADVSRGAGTTEGALTNAAAAYGYWQSMTGGGSVYDRTRAAAGEGGLMRAEPADVGAVFAEGEAARAKRELEEINKFIDDSVRGWFRIKDPAIAALRSIQEEVRTFGDNTALTKVQERFRRIREEVEGMGSKAPEGWREMVAQVQAQAEAQARLRDQLAKTAEAERERNRTLDGARESLKQAMIDVQNFGLTEGDAAVNTMKWAAGIRELSDAAKNLPLKDLIAATGMKINERAFLEGADSFKKDIEGMTQALGAQESELVKVNRRVAEYLKLMATLTGKPAYLTDAQIAAAEQARAYAGFQDLWNRGQAFQGFKISDIRPTPNVSNMPQGDGAALQPFGVNWIKTFEEEWHSGLLNMREDGQQIFSDFFFNIQDGFKGAVANMGLNFLQGLNRMAADAAASAVWGWIMNAVGLVAGGASAGGAGQSFGSGAGSSIGSAIAGHLTGFATGGSFTVGGAGGVDSSLVMFRATPGERVDVRTPAQQATGGGPAEVHIHVHGARNPSEFLSRETTDHIQRKYRRLLAGDAARTGGR